MITLKSPHPLRVLIIATCLMTAPTAAVLASIHFSKPSLSLSSPDVQLTSVGPILQPGLPVHLKIPKISVDSAIVHVGLTPQGDLAAPKAYENGGWYKDGPRPGEQGSSVIGGHYGRVNNKPSIFDNLHLLQKGDKIFITDEKGKPTTFIVTGSRSYSPSEDAAAVFRSGPGTVRLNLITCQGDWDSNQQSYTSRLVIFSEKE